MSKTYKLSVQLMLLMGLLGISLLSYVPLLYWLDVVSELEFNQLMVMFGALLGLVYYAICIVRFFLLQKDMPLTGIKYMLLILPSTFLINCYVWYMYLFFHRTTAVDKLDSQYYSTLIIAFTVFFMAVRIGKEVGALVKIYCQK